MVRGEDALKDEPSFFSLSSSLYRAALLCGTRGASPPSTRLTHSGNGVPPTVTL
jgi:hypothetical protein